MASPNTQVAVKSRRSLFGNSFGEGNNTYPEEYLDRIATETLAWKTYNYKVLRKREKLTKKLKDTQVMLTNEQRYSLGLIALNGFWKSSEIFYQRTNLLVDQCNQNVKWLEELTEKSNDNI